MNILSISRKYRSWISGAFGVALLVSCTSDFDKINTNPSALSSLDQSQLPFLFSKALSTGSINQGNYQVAQNLFSDQYAQYFACTASSFGSDRLVINQNWVGAAFNPIYTDVVPQLQTIFENADPASAEYAIANIWWVFSFHRVTDYWGPIPYSKAGVSGVTSVEYDGQDAIYADFFQRLTTAVATLEATTATQAYGGSYDLVYGGDISKWIKFANTLRLRLAMRISAVDANKAKTEAEAAVAAGVFQASPDDDALIKRSVKGGDGNGLAIMQWNEFRMSASMESVLKGYEDPRMAEYYMPTAASSAANAADPSKPLEWNGVRNGLTSAQMNLALNLPANNSQQGPRWTPTTLGLAGGVAAPLETPQNVMTTAEAFFLRAEGVMKGWNMGGGTAKAYYEDGIRNSFLQWGITADPASYIASPNVPIAPGDALNSPPMTNIPVAWGATQAIQEEQIATQKWIALFPDGMEGWADYRRSHKVKLYPAANSDNPLIPNPSTAWLRRIPFLLTETQNNPQGVESGKALLGGEDNSQTPLWWDKN